RGRALTRGRASVLAATMLVPTAAFALPFLGGSVARPSSYTTAAVVALVATGAAVVAVVPVAVRLHRTTAPGPRPRRPGQW
ncbi:MAG TPA: hypothetical protein VGF17_26850, partial [Phytomonospora sp.]